MLALFAAVGGSGLALVTAAQEMRSLHSAMDELQSKQDRTMAQYSRLLLERGTFASLQTVEVVATQELQMVFPQQVEEISP
jgi:cell division protein FtsL